jgi:hypothetical protein
MKKGNKIQSVLRYLCLSFVIGMGLVTIIGTGGGGGGGSGAGGGGDDNDVNNSPTADISSPTDGSDYDEGDTIIFSGTGDDPEDGPLTGGSLVWTSSRDGQVGTGTYFTRDNLSGGTHTVTLTATDSQGATGTDSVSVTVNPLTHSWGWKLATTPEDAHNFINGLAPYTSSHAVGSIAATSVGFYIFYHGDLEGTSWGWKLAHTTDDALAFLNRTGGYTGDPKSEAQLAYKADGMLYLFYRGTSSSASWGWKRSTSVGDMHDFLDGSGSYSSAKEGTIGGLNSSEILMFYRGDIDGEPGWGWKLAPTTDDAYDFLNGIGAYDTPVQEAKIFGSTTGDFYIFYKR